VLRPIQYNTKTVLQYKNRFVLPITESNIVVSHCSKNLTTQRTRPLEYRYSSQGL
jgi:hypothetical protein